MLKKDRRLELRISKEDLKKINFLVRRFGFNSRSQLLIYLVESAYIDMSECVICGDKIIEMTEQFICSRCGEDYSQYIHSKKGFAT
jgi:hypothetical protein